MNKKMMSSRRWILLLWMLLCGSVVSAQLSMKKTPDGILVTEGGEGVFLYHTTPESQNGEYECLNYIHPLFSIKGKVLTEAFPSDHPHQRGIYWAWRRIWIGDLLVGDSWELKDFSQSLEELEFLKQADGIIILQTEVNWLSEKWQKDGYKIPFVNERVKIHVHPTRGNMRRIDFEILLRALEQDVRIGGSEDDKGYGGFALRMVLPDHVSFTGPGGVVQPEENAVRSDGFVNISGKIEAKNKEGGIVIIDRSTNPGYPQPWILRDKNSMQNPVWPGREPVTVPMDKPIVLKYTLLQYIGKLSGRKIQSMLPALQN